MRVDKYRIKRMIVELLRNKPDNNDNQLVLVDGYLFTVEMYPFLENDTYESMLMRYATPYSFIYFHIDLNNMSIEEYINNKLNSELTEAIVDAQKHRNEYERQEWTKNHPN